MPRAIEKRIDLGYDGPRAAATPGARWSKATPLLLRELIRNLVDNALQLHALHAAAR